MSFKRLDQITCHEDLAKHAQDMQQPSMHLRYLLDDAKRLESFSSGGGGLFFDFSRQRLTFETRGLLSKVALELDLLQKFDQMCRGEKINTTEERAVLHVATRTPDRQ